jgi:hypothetical protein
MRSWPASLDAGCLEQFGQFFLTVTSGSSDVSSIAVAATSSNSTSLPRRSAKET